MTYLTPDNRRIAAPRYSALVLVLTLVFGGVMPGAGAGAAERARIEAFLNVTGFDVALDSIALTAESAPGMLGIDPGEFGTDWNRLTKEVFDTTVMRGLALDILENTLSEENLNYAAAFYATELGQRLVKTENEAHMRQDDGAGLAQGMKIIADLVVQGAARLELLKRMNRAIDTADTSMRALQEVQMRFLLAASSAGVIDLRMDADELRAFLKSQQGPLRLALQQSALSASAFTYRSFSDADVTAYVEALEQPAMQQVYELLNAVQYEIMANRFEVLAARMAELHPSQDI